MGNQTSRRDVLKGSLALAGLGVLGLPEWALPALAQGETVVPFTEWPENFNPAPAADRRLLDSRKIDGPFTPPDQFFTTQHYGHPVIDPATFRLKVTGLVDKPASLSLDDLQKLGKAELVAGFECSGNRRPVQGLIGNGRWTGVPLKAVLDRAGLKATAREIVFFGADKGPEDIEWRAQKFQVEQQYGRSLARDKALSAEPFLAYALNGQPLTRHQGSPAAPDRARLVRRAEREVARPDSRAGGSVPRQVPGALVPHPQGRDDRRRDEVGRDRNHPPAAQVVRGPGQQAGQHPPGARHRVERRHPDQVGRSEDRRGPVAAGDDGCGDERASTDGSCSTTRGTAPLPASTRWSRASPTPPARSSPRRRSSSRRRPSSRTTRSIRGR